jgi:hypothetical protein
MPVQLLTYQESCLLMSMSQPLTNPAHLGRFRLAQPAQTQPQVHRPSPERRVMPAQNDDAEGECQQPRSRQNNHRQTGRDDKPSHNSAAETLRPVAHVAPVLPGHEALLYQSLEDQMLRGHALKVLSYRGTCSDARIR